MNTPRRKVVLEAKNFSFSLGEKEILRDVSFSVRRGEYVAIVGPNGAGKTTLLKCFDRLLSGGSGELEIDGLSRRPISPKGTCSAGGLRAPGRQPHDSL